MVLPKRRRRRRRQRSSPFQGSKVATTCGVALAIGSLLLFSSTSTTGISAWNWWWRPSPPVRRTPVDSHRVFFQRRPPSFHDNDNDTTGNAVGGPSFPWNEVAAKQKMKQLRRRDMTNLYKPNNGTTATTTTTTTRYLIFRPPLEAAQGLGNLLNGLLAAHVLGQEFGRVVCVSSEWTDFFLAFASLDPKCHHYYNSSPRTSQSTLWILNFGKLPINECELQERLQGDQEVWHMVANAYPRWPNYKGMMTRSTTSPLPPRWEDFYKPTAVLVSILPWRKAQSTTAMTMTAAAAAAAAVVGIPPKTVVHLRQPDDDSKDHRAGLDDITLQTMATTLPSHTFLVTNRLEWYTYFQTRSGWDHPPWTGSIRHSALPNIVWGDGGGDATTVVAAAAASTSIASQQLQLWADWWTIYQAQRIYHTQSDFSGSAARWSQTNESYTLRGVDHDSGGLMLGHDVFWEWEEDGGDVKEVLPLRDRTNLQHCDLYPSGLDGSGYVMDWDDMIHDDLLDDRKQQEEQPPSD